MPRCASRRPIRRTFLLVAIAVAGAATSAAPALASPGPHGAMDGAAAASRGTYSVSMSLISIPFSRGDWVPLAVVALMLGCAHLCLRMAIQRARSG